MSGVGGELLSLREKKPNTLSRIYSIGNVLTKNSNRYEKTCIYRRWKIKSRYTFVTLCWNAWSLCLKAKYPEGINCSFSWKRFTGLEQLGNSKFTLLYEPLETDFELSSFGIRAPNHFRALIIPWWKIEHDFELSSFGITAPNHFRALIIPWLKIQTDFERYLITDHRIYVNH